MAFPYLSADTLLDASPKLSIRAVPNAFRTVFLKRHQTSSTPVQVRNAAAL